MSSSNGYNENQSSVSLDYLTSIQLIILVNYCISLKVMLILENIKTNNVIAMTSAAIL